MGSEREEDSTMKKQLAELKVDKSVDYYDKVAKALEDAGFTIVLSLETFSDRYYIVAEESED